MVTGQNLFNVKNPKIWSLALIKTNKFVTMIVRFNFECKDIISEINLMDEWTVNQHVFESEPTFHHDLFNPCCHIKPTNTNDDVNIYPVIVIPHNPWIILKLQWKLMVATNLCDVFRTTDEKNSVIIYTDTFKNEKLL